VRIADEWESFAKKVMPARVSHDQVIDMRGAFYAGALCVLDELKKSSSLSEDAGFALFDALQNDVYGYFIENYGHLQKHDS
jgi:hypothetical protein